MGLISDGEVYARLENVDDHQTRIRQLERLNAGLAAEIDQQRAWKESAMSLLTRYDDLAETFGGQLGSSKVTNLEVGVAALRAEVDRMRPVVDMAQHWNSAEYGSKRESVLAMRLSEVVNTYEAAKEGGSDSGRT